MNMKGHRTNTEVWIYRGDAAFFLVITAVAHHVTFPLVLQRMQDKYYQLCGVVLKHTNTVQNTLLEHTHSTPTVLHISVLNSLKGLTVLCGRGSTVITMWSLKVRITVSFKAGLFPAVTHTTCLYAQMYITEKLI